MSFHYPRCTINPCTCDDTPTHFADGTPRRLSAEEYEHNLAVFADPNLPPLVAPRPASEIEIDWDKPIGNPPGAYGHASAVLASLGVTR